MGFFVVSFVMFFIGIILFFTGKKVHNDNVYFEKNKRYGKAEVVGYDRGDQSEWYTLAVRILELNDGKVYGCHSGKINLGNYPKGTIVDVCYAPYKFMGVKAMTVYLIDNLPTSHIRIPYFFRYGAYLLFVLSAMFTIIGLFKVLIG